MCVKLTNPINFMFNWPFALKKDCLDPEPVMFLLGVVLWSEASLQRAETLHLDEGNCWDIILLNPAHKILCPASSLDDFLLLQFEKTPEATASISKQSAVSKVPSKSSKNYLPGLMKWLLALKER